MSLELKDVQKEVKNPTLLLLFAFVLFAFPFLAMAGLVYSACEYYTGVLYEYEVEEPARYYQCVIGGYDGTLCRKVGHPAALVDGEIVDFYYETILLDSSGHIQTEFVGTEGSTWIENMDTGVYEDALGNPMPVLEIKEDETMNTGKLLMGDSTTLRDPDGTVVYHIDIKNKIFYIDTITKHTPKWALEYERRPLSEWVNEWEDIVIDTRPHDKDGNVWPSKDMGDHILYSHPDEAKGTEALADSLSVAPTVDLSDGPSWSP